MRKDMIKRTAALILMSLFAISLSGCSSDEDEGSVVGVWQGPTASGQSEGFIYELTEDGRIVSSFGGFLYTGGTYEVKKDRLTLKNYPSYRVETVDNRQVTVVNYGNETEYRFEMSDTQLQLNNSGQITVWTRAATVIPTPTPTPTPPPTPEVIPTPTPEVTRITVLYDGAPLRWGNEFSQQIGRVDNKFSIEVRPDGIEVEVTLVSSDEEIFTVQKVDLAGVPNAFEVTAESLGAAELIITAGHMEERVTVRVLE